MFMCPHQSTPSPMQRSNPSPMQRSTPSPMQRSIPSPMQRSIPSSIQRSTPPMLFQQRSTPLSVRSLSVPFPPRIPLSEINNPSTSINISNTPSACFNGMNKPAKTLKIDPVENAFIQMNSALSTVASGILQNRNNNDVHDPDVIIGQLVTAELKRTMEPMKSTLKKKFMELLYSHNE